MNINMCYGFENTNVVMCYVILYIMIYNIQ